MERKVNSPITIIFFSLLTTFFNQVLLAPYIYKLNFKLAFLIIICAYLLQAFFIVMMKNIYEKIRVNNYFPPKKEMSSACKCPGSLGFDKGKEEGEAGLAGSAWRR